MKRPVVGLVLATLLAGVCSIAPTAGVGATTPPTDPTASSEPPGTDESATTTTTTTTTTITTTPDPTMLPATRGSTIQLVTTLPPPPTAPPPTLAPPPPPNPFAVPANSGSGRRVVYSKSRMRLWVINADGSVARTYLVSGRFNQPNLGTYSVYSRSTYTCNINHSDVCMRWMVRFAKGPSGDNIGFHEIPRKNGVPIQSDAQLGQALSSGCVRQSTADAQFMWAWAGIGTTVVVIW
ncbi:MAG: L,D-transpeptidase [Actinomycetota bacterium]|nr:L,D-transpeptidase [Actinomycetota bacterium]